MILNGTPEEWVALWGAIEDEMQDSIEKGLTVIFSVHEVETVCAVKMMQVHSSCETASSNRAVVDTQCFLDSAAVDHNTNTTALQMLAVHQTCGCSTQSTVKAAPVSTCLNSANCVLQLPVTGGPTHQGHPVLTISSGE